MRFLSFLLNIISVRVIHSFDRGYSLFIPIVYSIPLYEYAIKYMFMEHVPTFVYYK